MDGLEKWLEIVIYVVSVIIGLITLLFPSLKISKNKSKVEKWLKITKEIPELVIKAEQEYGSGHGKSKFRYVMTEIKLRCLEEGLRINEDEISSLIEDAVKVSKEVNKKEG